MWHLAHAMRKEAAHRHKEPMGGKYSLAAEKWDTVRDSGTVTLLWGGYKSLCGMLRTAMHTGWKRNTTDSWASKYNNFRETKMNPENVVFCVLKTQVNWTLVRCLLVRNRKIRIQIKAYKRKKSVSNISLPCRENGFRYSSAERKITGLIFRIFPCDLVAR